MNIKVNRKRNVVLLEGVHSLNYLHCTRTSHTYNMLGTWGADYSLTMTIAFQV